MSYDIGRTLSIGSVLVDIGLSVAEGFQNDVLQRMKSFKFDTKQPLTYAYNEETKVLRITGWEHLALDDKSPVTQAEVSTLNALDIPLKTRPEHGYGGAANNSARGCKRMGKSPMIMAGLGRDENGAFLEKQLTDCGFSTEGIVWSDVKPSGFSLILVFGGDRLILTYRGASALMPEDIPEGFAETLKPDLVILSNLANFDTSRAVLQGLSGKGINKIWIPGKKDVIALSQSVDLPEGLSDSSISCLSLNRDEWGYSSIDAQMKIANTFDTVIVTDGGNDGWIYRLQDGKMVYTSYAPAALRLGYEDATGAGDAFATSFAIAMGWYEGDTAAAAEFAKRVSADVIGYKDPYSGYPLCTDRACADEFVFTWDQGGKQAKMPL